MFFLTYLRAELRRRIGRTVLTVLGLGVGVALVVSTSALSAGLDRAQEQVLGPLAGVATDLTVTKRPVPFAASGAFQAGLTTNLSELGEPGERFSTDSFTQSQPSFTDEEASKVAGTDGVSATSRALLLQGIHQEGTIPEITVAAEDITQTQQIDPLTPEEQEAFQRCMDERAPQEEGATQQGPGGGGQRFQILSDCLPERFREQSFTFRVPERQVDTPETDIESTPYTIAGIEPVTEIGIISAEQVTQGRFLAANGEAMVSESYAESNDLDVGGTLQIKDRSYTIVGLVRPPLGGNAADIYLTLTDLQQLSEREGQANVLLARTDDASKVAPVSDAVADAVPGTNVSDASDLAEQVAGSLVDSGNLIRRLGLVLAIVGIGAAIAIAALLTLSSVAKRTRELGTLKAIGWRPSLVVRQILGEAAAQGVLGAAVGVGLGLGAATLLGAVAPSLEARAVGGGGPGVFGLGRIGAEQASQAVPLTAPVTAWIVLVAAGLAVLAGLVAGAVGAWRAARLRPADAMREVG